MQRSTPCSTSYPSRPHHHRGHDSHCQRRQTHHNHYHPHAPTGTIRNERAVGVASTSSSVPSVTSSPVPRLLTPDVIHMEGSLQQAEAPGSFLWSLPPLWRLVLLSDGSVTRHLKLLTGAEPVVECIDMRVVDNPYSNPSTSGTFNGERKEDEDGSALHVPAEVERISGPLLQRQVFIKDAQTNQPLVYAASWWNKEEADRYLKDRNKSMWRSLQEGHLELFRDIGRVVRGDSPGLEMHFGQSGPFWGRYYTFWSGHKPLTVVYEAFSPRLERYLDL